MNKKRIKKLNQKERGKGTIIYWMNRDQRVEDNWALILAQKIALEEKRELKVLFNLTPNFPSAYERHYDFMLKGLKEIEDNLQKLNIEFVLTLGDHVEEILKYSKKEEIGAIVCDFSPIRFARKWRNELANQINCAFYEVDAHNIIPIWETSSKEEFAAYTIRPKINKKLSEFLEEFPKVKEHVHNKSVKNKINWEDISIKLGANKDVKPVNWILPGEKEAKRMLGEFIDQRLTGYSEKRNDPNENFLSNLSPYYHFGHLSPQRAALEVQNCEANQSDKDSYLEELIVRRELSDNFCFYNENYDNFDGLRDWAKKTLNNHLSDIREFTYTFEEFESANTHDDLWNAAQMQMVKSGKMHGYMRMYWAKKILEWTNSPHEAIEFAIKLNDKYQLDGRDPNGYVGVLWSIGGIHDRAWVDRPIFGQIRYMNYNGCKRKFNVNQYIEKWL